MIQDPNVERLIRKSIEPLNKQISMLQIELNGVKEQLAIPRVVQAKPEEVCKIVRKTFDDWIFGVELSDGEKLIVVDSADFNEIITEIEDKLKNPKNL